MLEKIFLSLLLSLPEEISHSIAIFLFDKKAVLIESENFEYHMSNYKELRDNIMSLEKDKIEFIKR